MERRDMAGVKSIDATNKAMSEAISEARKRLPEALNFLNDESVVVKIKAGFDTVTGTEEHMWFLNVKAVDQKTLEGELGNEPLETPSMKKGKRYRFPITRISDWGAVMKDKTSTGFFTMKVLERESR